MQWIVHNHNFFIRCLCIFSRISVACTRSINLSFHNESSILILIQENPHSNSRKMISLSKDHFNFSCQTEL